jgi:hypothetical protein
MTHPLPPLPPSPPPALAKLHAFMRDGGYRAADLARGIKKTKAAAGRILRGEVDPKPQTRIDIEVWTRRAACKDAWDTGKEPSPKVKPAPKRKPAPKTRRAAGGAR